MQLNIFIYLLLALKIASCQVSGMPLFTTIDKCSIVNTINDTLFLKIEAIDNNNIYAVTGKCLIKHGKDTVVVLDPHLFTEDTYVNAEYFYIGKWIKADQSGKTIQTVDYGKECTEKFKLCGLDTAKILVSRR